MPNNNNYDQRRKKLVSELDKTETTRIGIARTVYGREPSSAEADYVRKVIGGHSQSNRMLTKCEAAFESMQSQVESA